MYSFKITEETEDQELIYLLKKYYKIKLNLDKELGEDLSVVRVIKQIETEISKRMDPNHK